MRLVAGVARLTAGMFSGVHLGEALRLGDIFGVAADAELSDIGKLRGDAGGIVGMFGKGTMAGFAIDMGVDAFGLGVRFFGMAAFAGLMASVTKGMGSDFGDGVAPEVAIAAEALGDEGAAEDEEENEAGEENPGHAEEVGDVLEFDHSAPGKTGPRANVRLYSAGGHRTTVQKSRAFVMVVTGRKKLLSLHWRLVISGRGRSEQLTANG